MMTRELKEYVKEKYNFKCCKCGADNELTIDHKWPVSEGGTDDLDNLQVLCMTCNKAKSNKLPLSVWQKIRYALNVSDRVQLLKNEVKGITSRQDKAIIGAINIIKSRLGELKPIKKDIDDLYVKYNTVTGLQSVIDQLRNEIKELKKPKTRKAKKVAKKKKTKK